MLTHMHNASMATHITEAARCSLPTPDQVCSTIAYVPPSYGLPPRGADVVAGSPTKYYPGAVSWCDPDGIWMHWCVVTCILQA